MKKNDSNENYEKNSEKLVLGMISKTWNKEIHGLFNYESRSCQKSKFFFDENCVLIITKAKVSKVKYFI